MSTEILENEQKVYDRLEKLGIDYKVIEHDPLFTAEDLKSIMDRAEGVHCKNLFLRNAKGNKYYMIVLEHDKDVDLKNVKELIGSTRLSFGSAERLQKVLNLTPGSVNPFSLINDDEKLVELYMDKEIFRGEPLNFHPNVNNKMVTIAEKDILKYLESVDHQPEIIKF